MIKPNNSKRENNTSGRTIIIVVLVFISASSFILGYFVGKATIKDNMQTEFMTFQKQHGSEESAVQEPTQKEETRPTTDSIFEQLEGAKDLKKEEKTSPYTDSAKTDSLQVVAKKEAQQPTAKMIKPVEDSDIYTVQVGAFKNQKDAEALKHKLEDKKYKAYIKKTVTPPNLKFFKVRIGEFTKREDAEVLVIKLKKVEGLNAFVTLKNDDANKEEKSPAAKKETSR